MVKDSCFVVLDDQGGRERKGKGHKPVVFPGEKAEDVPREFAGNEMPDPLPAEGRGKKAGFPITVTFAENVRVTKASATLKEKNKTIDGWLSSPEKPAYTRAFQRNTICLIPKAPLRPKTTYQVTATATVNGVKWTRTWSFTTTTDKR
jgi:hypothetical protein